MHATGVRNQNRSLCKVYSSEGTKGFETLSWKYIDSQSRPRLVILHAVVQDTNGVRAQNETKKNANSGFFKTKQPNECLDVGFFLEF